MSYTSVSRRLIKVKVKAKSGRGKQKSPVGRSDTIVHGSARAPEQELFQPSPPRWRPAAPPRRWRFWSADTLVIALAGALVITIYLLAQNSRNNQAQSIRTLQAPYAAPSMLQAPPSPAPIDRADGKAPAGGGRSPAGQPPPIDQNVQTALDDGRKLILPMDVTGSCDIGERSIKDFSGCLTRNGARVE